MLEVYRRFRNFNEIREILFTRFLGLYVPPIPEKKKMVILLEILLMCMIRVIKTTLSLKKDVLSWTDSSKKFVSCPIFMNLSNSKLSLDLMGT
jgi:hypothetical protein